MYCKKEIPLISVASTGGIPSICGSASLLLSYSTPHFPKHWREPFIPISQLVLTLESAHSIGMAVGRVVAQCHLAHPQWTWWEWARLGALAGLSTPCCVLQRLHWLSPACQVARLWPTWRIQRLQLVVSPLRQFQRSTTSAKTLCTTALCQLQLCRRSEN